MTRSEASKIQSLRLAREAATVFKSGSPERTTDTPVVVSTRKGVIVEYGARDRAYSFTQDSLGRVYLNRADSVNPTTNRNSLTIARNIAREKFKEERMRLRKVAEQPPKE